MLKVENLVKYYGNNEGVGGISFEVKPGEILGFLGPNGAGKTTTIKICSGLLLPSSGKVTLCNYDIVKNPVEAKKNLGYVADEPFLYDKLTGWQFLNFIGDIYGLKESERLEQLDYLFNIFELEKKKDDLIGTYSKGMKRKIALMAGVVHNPKILLLDEPTLGLDALSSKKAKDLIKDLAYKKNTAVLLTTHVLEMAESICDRIALISKGRIVAEGTLAELKEKSKMATNLEEIFVKLTKEEFSK
ncbi:ABC transporter ATP-binding protein [Anaerobranca gottschalkii]|uniref:ABC-2 type transport system ATP-binding protein n=1 Tax=Anaerobranca gottschalkii DSM 13577 TaxID=1120990 RepID=A0A1H9ZGZ3_9FIRM|nr:ABC transporter ATP-binding protein [Anaerobranca gottschalkii]SES80934.1 ABC-2 type transport system ATP-binding protein [Anaerobranca gottschalkii DSM 13577]